MTTWVLVEVIHTYSINSPFLSFWRLNSREILVNTFSFHVIMAVGFVSLRTGCSFVVYFYVTAFVISSFIVLILLFLKIGVPDSLEQYIF